MTVTVVTLSDLHRRGSWLPRDFIYKVGESVKLMDETDVVLARVKGPHERTVMVSTIEYVPGSRTPFSCAVPSEVSVYDIALRKDARR